MRLFLLVAGIALAIPVVADPGELTRLPVTTAVHRLAVAPGGRTIGYGSWDGTVHLVDRVTGIDTRLPGIHNGFPMAIAYNRFGSRLATGAIDLTIKIWDTRRRTLLTTIQQACDGSLGTDAVTALQWLPNGRLVSGGTDGIIRVWSVAKPGYARQIGQFAGSTAIYSLTLSPDASLLVSSDRLGFVRVWNLANQQLVSGFQPLGQRLVYQTRFAPGGQQLVVVGESNQIRFYDTTTWQRTDDIYPNSWPIGVDWSADGANIVTIHLDFSVRLWDAKTHVLLATLLDSGYAESVRFTPDGNQVVFHSWGKEIKFWRIK